LAAMRGSAPLQAPAPGLAGGLIYDQVEKSEQSAYAQGYAAGQSRRRYQPPQ